MTVHEIREPGPEPIATLQVRSAPLRGPRSRPRTCRPRSTSCRWSPCSAASPRARPWSAGAEELRAKESDRISGVVEGSVGSGRRHRGAARTASSVQGTGGLRGGTLDARGDHRLAMVGAIAGLASKEGVEVDGFEAVAVSYPRFERDLRALLA